MRNLLFSILCICLITVRSQNENNIWCLSSAGISFNSNPPATFSINGTPNVGCSSISDAAGNLKMYAFQSQLFNSAQQQLAGSSGQTPSAFPGQGTLIVKQPGNNPSYYAFDCGTNGIFCSVVNMSLAAGLGSVVTQNNTLTSTPMNAKCAATRHCNGRDIWIVVQEFSSYVTRAYLLSPAGLSAAVTSTTTFYNNVSAGMKFSPDGNLLASTEWASGLRLMNFDRATGAVSGGTILTTQGNFQYGVEFSPDGSKLYAVRSGDQLLQWDLAAASASAILASQYTVYATSIGIISGQLQLAPNGKIYGYCSFGQVLTTIQNPNGAGPACNFTLSGLSLAPFSTSRFLPNQLKPGPPLPVISSVSLSCSSFSFSTQSATISGISSSAPLSQTWVFGDPASGINNTSTLGGPVHNFSAPGTYTVKLVLYSSCGGSDTIFQSVNVPGYLPGLAPSGNTLLCMGQTTSLTASGATSYTWTLPNLSASSGSLLVISPTTSGLYTLQGTNGSVCPDSRTFSITILPTTIFTISGNTDICAGESATISAGGAVSYTWHSVASVIGSGSVQVFSPVSTTNYTVVGNTSANTCTSQQFFTVNVHPYANLQVDPPILICAGQVASLSATGATYYLWSAASGTLSTNSTFTLVPLSTSIYTVAGNADAGYCTVTATTAVEVDLCTGLEQNRELADMEVWPTPAKDFIFIQSEHGGDVIIRTDQGELQFRQTLIRGTNRIELSSLQDGIYFCIIKDLTTVVSRKVVKLNQ